ncbi:hypothetical protein [Caulobacter segnis]
MDKLKAYVTGRGGRGEFWIWTVASFVATILGNVFIYRSDVLWSSLSFLPWVIYAGRRLRDFGASPWWVLFPPGGGFVVGFVVALLNSATPTPAISPIVRMLIMGVVTWSFIIYVGSRKGKPPAAPEAAEA